MITVTFIRHGESEDNLRSVWAGWKDAPLSELGKKQAYVLGQAFASTPLTHIYASPLLRAHTTAQFVQHHQPDVKPPLTVNANLREQNFGIAEGHKWAMDTPQNETLESLYERRIFPVLYKRHEKFPDGESLNDLAVRAELAIRECVLPHLPEAPLPADEHSGVHIALASHGLCIGELVQALIRLDPEANRKQNHFGLLNTAWTRVNVRVRDTHSGPIDPANPPPLEICVTHVNDSTHLEMINDHPASHFGIDGAGAEARAFFSGLQNAHY